jgi:hypothetical protein
METEVQASRRSTISGEAIFRRGTLPGSKAVKERIEELIAQAPHLPDDEPQRRAWVVTAQNTIQLVSPSSRNPYYSAGEMLVSKTYSLYGATKGAVSQMAALLTRLLEEIDRGLLTTIENHVIAVTFDDFLDHGAEYLKHGRKDEAGVIAGIVFGDTIRRICRVLSIPEKGVALDTLISELAKRDPPVLTALKAKRARAAAGLRTSAAHARWAEIDLGDVAPVIELTKELIGVHLG